MRSAPSVSPAAATPESAGGLRRLADRLGTAPALGIPFLDERGRDPGPAVLRPLRRLAPEPAMAGAVAEIRLIGFFVVLSPLRHELGKLHFGQFRHLEKGDALVTVIAWLRPLVFVCSTILGAWSCRGRWHDLCYMLDPALI